MKSSNLFVFYIIPASSRKWPVTHTFLMIFLFSQTLMHPFPDLVSSEMLHGLPYHSTVFICSTVQSFINAGTFSSRTSFESLLAEAGSAGLKLGLKEVE